MRRKVLLGAGAALLSASIALGCAQGWPARYRAAHPGFRATDARPGARASETLAGLDLPAVQGISVELRKLEAMRTDVDPWQRISPGHMDSAPGVSVAAADRVCSVWQGLHRVQVERVSWFVADHGRLVAFDAPRFGSDCKVTHRYQPAPARYRNTEQALLSWVDQRFPGGALPLDERLAMAPALVRAGRLDQAREIVHRARQEADRIESDLESQVPRSEADRNRLAQREQGLRDAAEALDRSIRKAAPAKP